MLIDVLGLCLIVIKGFLCIFIIFLVGIIFGRGWFNLWFIEVLICWGLLVSKILIL